MSPLEGMSVANLIGPKILYVGFCGVIDADAVNRIASTFNTAVNQQFDGVHMTISSPGGYVSEGIYLYHHLRSLPLQITMHNMGMVASIATTIFAAAERRVASTNSVFMIHPVQSSLPGNVIHGSLKSVLESAEADEARIENILRERAAFPEEILTQRRTLDIYFTADDALNFGLLHEIADFTLPPGNQIFHI